METKIRIRKEVKVVGAFLVLLGIIAFAERKYRETSLQELTVQLENVDNNHFLEESDVIEIMDWKGEQFKGANIADFDLRSMERKLRENPYVGDADLYTDLKGNLIAKVMLRRPIARIVQENGPHAYISEEGTIMPLSDKYTSRVVLISGPYAARLMHTTEQDRDDAYRKDLIQLLQMIHHHPFWKAQIAQMNIDRRGNITLLTQVGDERIEFGKPAGAEKTLSKLMIYYKEILPRVGWNKYDRVNLEYEGQIIAE